MSDPMTPDPLERELGDIMSPDDAPLPKISPVERRAHIDAALLAASEPDRAPSYRPRMIALAVAAILLLALGVGVFMNRSFEPDTLAPSAEHQPEREVANRASDSPAPDHAPDPVGDPLFAPFGEGISHVADDAPVRLSVDSTRAVLASGARARLLSRSDRDLVIALDRGEATFEVDPARSQRVRVRTEYGVVEVVGTVFTVSLDEDSMRVSVERGEVIVRARDRPAGRVRAGESLAVTRAERPARVGSRSPRRGAPREDTRERIAPDAPQEALTSEALLARALGARASGDWQGALDAYEEILARHPRSDAARAAAISVARISLDHADRPGRALAAMERFLASRPKDDALRPLAHQARVEALEALGRADEAKKARDEMKTEIK